MVRRLLEAHSAYRAFAGHLHGGGYQSRRDYAIISVFKDVGVRLCELARACDERCLAARREAVVTGEGDMQRTIRFTYDTARALDRYQRERAGRLGQ